MENLRQEWIYHYSTRKCKLGEVAGVTFSDSAPVPEFLDPGSGSENFSNLRILLYSIQPKFTNAFT